MEKTLFGLLGRKLSHSFSATFFNDKFARENICAEYVNFQIPDISLFTELIIKYPRLRGLNVTIPYKEAIIPYLHTLSHEAEDTGAVNVIRIDRKENRILLSGHNSDIYGFAESFQPLIESAPSGPALILGTGGASKAAGYALSNIFGKEIHFVSRTRTKADLTYQQLTPDIIRSHPLIVNTTPLGMFPDIDSYPDIPYEALLSGHVCLDIVYNPGVTEFCRRCSAMGAETKNGLDMLCLQALKAWEIWNGTV